MSLSELTLEYLHKYRASKKVQLEFLNDCEHLVGPYLELMTAFNRQADELLIRQAISQSQKKFTDSN